jgi:hypothetical protein
MQRCENKGIVHTCEELTDKGELPCRHQSAYYAIDTSGRIQIKLATGKIHYKIYGEFNLRLILS